MITACCPCSERETFLALDIIILFSIFFFGAHVLLCLLLQVSLVAVLLFPPVCASVLSLRGAQLDHSPRWSLVPYDERALCVCVFSNRRVGVSRALACVTCGGWVVEIASQPHVHSPVFAVYRRLFVRLCDCTYPVWGCFFCARVRRRITCDGWWDSGVSSWGPPCAY